MPVTIPEGFTPHDGSGCPVHPWSAPATFRRMGTVTRMGYQTARDLELQASDPWTWSVDDPGPMDITAYKPEPDEYVRADQWTGAALSLFWILLGVGVWQLLSG